MQGQPNLAAVKLAVIVMAVLILAAIGVIGVTIAGRISEDEGAGAGFGEVEVEIPEGCTIAAAESDGARLILRLEGLAERGCRQVLLLDLETGAPLGRVTSAP